jgi:hypothetical protein
MKGDGNLPFHKQSLARKQLKHQYFVCGLEQSRTKVPVEMKSAIHRNLSKAFDLLTRRHLRVFV